MSRLRAQHGFTLVELLIAMAVGVVVILAASALIDTSVNVNAQVAGRADAAERGRPAMDEITRALRSQVCVNETAPITSASPTQVTFTADLSDGSMSPTKRQIAFNSGPGAITETVWPGSGLEPATVTWNATPKTTPLIADVSATSAGAAIFTYWAVKPDTGGTDFTQLGSTVATADLARIARIDIAYIVRPSGVTNVDRRAVTFNDRVTVRSVNPDSASPEATCPRAT